MGQEPTARGNLLGTLKVNKVGVRHQQVRQG